MKTNKTPIQEFKCLFIEQFSPLAKSFESVTFSYEYLNILDLINESLEKEKQFAFDCWSDGVKYSADRLSFGKTSSIEDRFEQFYSQYVEQHTK